MGLYQGLNAVVFLQLVIFNPVYTSTSPPKCCPDNCTCEEPSNGGLIVTCTGIKTLDVEFPTQTTSIVICQLETDAVTINDTSSIQKLTSVKSIEIFSSQIGRIEEHAFCGFLRLEKFGIYHSSVGTIESLAFCNLKNLPHFEIHHSSVDIIKSEAFSEISNVNEFTFNNVTVNEIHAYAFSRVRRVVMFAVRNSELGLIETGAFYQCTFAFLYIHNNRFRHIMCGTIDIAIKESMNKYSVGENSICCGCNMLWMYRPDVKATLGKFLEGLVCSNRRTPETNRTLSSYTWSDFPCPDLSAREQTFCPSVVKVEKLRTSAVHSGCLNHYVSFTMLLCIIVVDILFARLKLDTA